MFRSEMKRKMNRYGVFFALLLGMSAVWMCGCGKEKNVINKKVKTEDYLEKCVTMKKYEDSYAMENMNVNYVEKTEYRAEKDSSKVLGYKADLSLRCEKEIPEEDLVKLACEELSLHMIGNPDGFENIAECIVKVFSKGSATKPMLIRFAEKARSEYAIYMSEDAKGKAAYYINSDITEDMIFYTEVTVKESEYKLETFGNLKGIGAIKEVAILKEMTEEELCESFKDYILREQEVLANSEGDRRIEYVFDVYLYGEKYKTITMRAVDKEMSDWESVQL